MRLRLVSPDSPDWDRCVHIIQERYFTDYDAKIDPEPDQFVFLDEDGNRGAGVAGVSDAKTRDQIMAESYLDTPIEELISERSGYRVARSNIVEVGPLAASGAGIGRTLVKSLPALCWCQGAQTLVCTVTERLAKMLDLVGIQLNVLTKASIEHLPAEQHASWGSYYETNPVTGYIDLSGYDAEILDVVSGTTKLSLFDAKRDLRTLTTSKAGH
jgi:hypothetical protein